MVKRIVRDIDKQYILENIDQVDIFSHYLEVDETDIYRCIKYNILMTNPLRFDENPTVGFKYNNKGKLKMRDFSGFFWGDCFDLVAFVLGKNVNNKEQFRDILLHIAIQFDLVTDDGQSREIERKKVRKKVEIIKKEKRVIEFTIRSYNSLDLEYWNKLIYNEALTKKYLEYFNTYPVKEYWIDREFQSYPKYHYRANDPCYAYYGFQDSDGIDNIKLYFPKRKREDKYPRFITNSSFIFGIHHLVNLKEVDFLLLTKSAKDVISLYSYIVNYNPKIGIVSLASESTPPSKEQYEWLCSFVTKHIKNTNNKAVFTLLDFDLAGVKLSNRMRKEYNTYPFFLTNGRFGSVDYLDKDFTDLTNNRTKDEIDNLISVALKNINKIIN